MPANTDWSKNPGQLLWKVLVLMLAIKTLDIDLFGWIYRIPGIDPMPWQQR
jgi:hypothetical protein